jgi:hypothetical protein
MLGLALSVCVPQAEPMTLDDAGATETAGEDDLCPVPEPPEPKPEGTAEACSDGIDNDEDGWIDCEDLDCVSTEDPVIADYCDLPSPENTLEACSDGIDNDEDGFSDCDDFSCSMSIDLAVLDYCGLLVEDSPQACADGLDNDCDGVVDCEDSDCATACQ